MPCMCLLELNAAIEGAEMALPELSATLPSLPELPAMPGLPELTGLAAGLGSFEMAADASFDMAGAIGLELPDLSGLMSMAHVGGAFGFPELSADWQASLDLAAGSININAPALGELAELVAPMISPALGLQGLAGLTASVDAAFGVDLMLPDAMPQIEMALGAMDFSFAPSLDVMMELGLTAQLMAAAEGLGFELPGELPAFAAALDAAVSLEVPELTIPTPEWSGLIGLMSAMEEINLALGIDLMAPGAAAAIELGLPTLEANLGALEGLGLPELPAGAEAAASLGASLNAALPAAGMEIPAMPELGGLAIPELPAMGDMSLAAAFAASFEGAMGGELMLAMPCPNIFCIA